MRVRAFLTRHGDLLLAGVLAATLVTEVVLGRESDLRLTIPAALLCTLPIALRRRSPLVAFLLSLIGVVGIIVLEPGFDNDSLALVVVLVLIFYSAGRYARGPEAVIAVLVVLGCVLAGLRYDSPPPYDMGDVGFLLIMFGGPWAAGLAIRLRADREQRLRDNNLELTREQEAHTRNAVLAERARIARELHDVVSHAIAVTVLQARGARRTVGVDPQVRAALDTIVATNTAALGDMRRLLTVLRTDDAAADEAADPQPSLAQLDVLIESVRSSGVTIDFDLTGSLEPVPPGVGLTAYRITQEALTNVLRYGRPAARARIRIDLGADELELCVQNDGDPDGGVVGVGSGQGLIGIRERVAVVGGSVEAESVSGGFRLLVRLPYTVGADVR